MSSSLPFSLVLTSRPHLPSSPAPSSPASPASSASAVPHSRFHDQILLDFTFSVDMYDRTGERPWTCLTIADKVPFPSACPLELDALPSSLFHPHQIASGRANGRSPSRTNSTPSSAPRCPCMLSPSVSPDTTGSALIPRGACHQAEDRTWPVSIIACSVSSFFPSLPHRGLQRDCDFVYICNYYYWNKLFISHVGCV